MINKKENLLDDTKSTEEQALSQTEAPYDSNKFYTDIKLNIVQLTSSNVFLNEFFKTFWDGKVSEVNERVFVPFQLCKESLI